MEYSFMYVFIYISVFSSNIRLWIEVWQIVCRHFRVFEYKTNKQNNKPHNSSQFSQSPQSE